MMAIPSKFTSHSYASTYHSLFSLWTMTMNKTFANANSMPNYPMRITESAAAVAAAATAAQVV